MAGQALEKFGEFVVTQLWNNALEHHELLSKKHWKTPALQGLQESLASLNDEQKEIVRRCVVNALGVGMHDLLFALQEAHDLEQGIDVVVDGSNIAECSDGLHGELYGDNGWLAKYGRYKE